jgi:hypothetical protein
MLYYIIVDTDRVTPDVLDVCVTTEPRKTADGTKTVVKFHVHDGMVPLEITKLQVPLYTRDEILPLLSTSEWNGEPINA